MLNQRNFEIAKLASKKEEAPEPVKCLYVAPDKTVATDGHMIIELSGVDFSEDILPFEELTPQSDFEPFLMESCEALSLAKVFIKSESRAANMMGIDPNTPKGAALALRQPGSEKIFRIQKPLGNFPNYEVVFPPVEEEIGSVTVNLDLLIPLLRELAKVNPAVRIGFYGPENQVRFDCHDGLLNQSARAALMPMKV